MIYIAIRVSQGETIAITSHVPMAKRAGATRDELKKAILMTVIVCGIKRIASYPIPALEAYDNAK
ncbi:MAG: carboxymuconolactone decarboxylase family protein [Bacteroidales bacterium]|nr:carboxymuconolactone decarboxylase family protein [Bacteroidales bacterium]